MLRYSRRIFFLLILSAFTVSWGQNQPRLLSFVQLLASPHTFDGALVSVRGYLSQMGGDHDMTAVVLYLHKEDADNLLDNSILISPNDKVRNDLREFNREYVTLTGTFRAVAAANGSYIPEIVNVQACTRWSNPKAPLGVKPGQRQ